MTEWGATYYRCGIAVFKPFSITEMVRSSGLFLVSEKDAAAAIATAPVYYNDHINWANIGIGFDDTEKRDTQRKPKDILDGLKETGITYEPADKDAYDGGRAGMNTMDIDEVGQWPVSYGLNIEDPREKRSFWQNRHDVENDLRGLSRRD